jgi:hypothetical protein
MGNVEHPWRIEGLMQAASRFGRQALGGPTVMVRLIKDLAALPCRGYFVRAGCVTKYMELAGVASAINEPDWGARGGTRAPCRKRKPWPPVAFTTVHLKVPSIYKNLDSQHPGHHLHDVAYIKLLLRPFARRRGLFDAEAQRSLGIEVSCAATLYAAQRGKTA